MKIITIEKSRLDAFKSSRRDHGINPDVTHVVAAFDSDDILLDCEACNDSGDNVGIGIYSSDSMVAALLDDALENHDVRVVPGAISPILVAS